jgi:hypothetical protein
MIRKILLIAGTVLLCANHPASADKVFAHSKSLGMSFTAIGDPWCVPDVSMQVTAGDASKFDTPDYGTTIQKLGHVLVRECPQASTLSITGLAGGQTAWKGSAARADEWIAQQARATTAATAPEPAAPEATTATVEETAVRTDATTPAASKESASQAETTPTPVSDAVASRQTASPAPATVPSDGTEATPSPTATAATSGADGGETSAPAETAPAIQAMVIAGWKPGEQIKITGSASDLKEIVSQDDGCKIRSLVDIKPEFHPTFKMNHEYDCDDGYVQSTYLKRQDQASLYYEGQKQSFNTLNGYWYAGYNLHSSFPKEVVAVYDPVQQQAGYGYGNQTRARMLVWIGEDRDLRAHYFATYNSTGQQWIPDRNLVIVVTDNEELKNNPENTVLATSLAGIYKDFHGYRNTDQFSSVPFIITDKMHDMPVMDYQKAVRESNPDASYYKAGNAVHYRGTPWSVEVKTDFVGKRKAFAAAEQQRIEAEKKRVAALRARHQASLDQQYQDLSTASNYDRIRFYATLMLAKDRMQAQKINFTSNRTYYQSPLNAAINFSHPAQYLNMVKDGKASVGGPMYLLVEADDGEIEEPYPMIVERNEAAGELDDWMLLRLGPEFGFHFDDDDRPVFAIAVEEAVSCKTDKCLGEMDASTMMKNWYEDDEMEFSVAAKQ